MFIEVYQFRNCASKCYGHSVCYVAPTAYIVLWTEIFSSAQVNPDMVPEFENAGLQFVGKDDTGRRMEV